MRSYEVYGVQNDGEMVYVDTVYSSSEGKQIHSMMKVQGYYDEIVVLDYQGNKVMHRNLRSEENLLNAA